jgi:hypothetical protein
MLRHITALVFILGFVFQTFRKPFIMLDFYTNTSAYARNCINKARPAMHCKGKCQVMKKIQEEEKKNAEKEAWKFQYKADVLSSRSFYSYTLMVPGNLLNKAVPYEPGNRPIDRSVTVFHPPSA